MKNSTFTFLLAFTASAALAAGFGLGKMASSPAESGLNPQGSSLQGKMEPSSAPPDRVTTQLGKKTADLISTLEEDGAESFIGALQETTDPAMRLELLLEAIAKFNSSEFETLLDFLLANEGVMEPLAGDMDPLVLLMTAWAEIDLEAATAKFEEATEPLSAFFDNSDNSFGVSLPPDIRNVRAYLARAKYANFSPAEALRKIREEGNFSIAPDSFFETGAEINLAAVDEILLIEDKGYRGAFANSLFETWFRRDPEAALDGFARYLEHPDITVNDTWYEYNYPYRAISDWAMTDPEAALRAIDRIPDVEFLQNDVLRGIVKNIAASDPDRALALFEKHSKWKPTEFLIHALDWEVAPEFRLRVMDQFLAAGGELDGDFIAGRNSDPFAESHPLDDILDADPAATTDWLLEHPEVIPGAMDPGDPNLGDLPSSEQMFTQSWTAARNLGIRMGTALAGQDLEAAFEKMAQIPAGALRDGYIEGLAERGAHIDPVRTAEFLNILTDVEAAQANAALARGWLEGNADSAMAFAASVGDETFGVAARQRAHRDIAGTLNWMVANDHPNFVNYVSDPSMHINWIEQDAFGGAAVVASLPPDVALEAVPTYISKWADIAPDEASSYLNKSLEPGPIRDAAIVSLAAAIAQDDPESAVQWVSSITDEALREEALLALP